MWKTFSELAVNRCALCSSLMHSGSRFRIWLESGLHTSLHLSPREWTLKCSDLDDVVACYNPKNRHSRRVSECFKSYIYEVLTKSDKVNLDKCWLKDGSLEE